MKMFDDEDLLDDWETDDDNEDFEEILEDSLDETEDLLADTAKTAEEAGEDFADVVSDLPEEAEDAWAELDDDLDEPIEAGAWDDVDADAEAVAGAAAGQLWGEAPDYDAEVEKSLSARTERPVRRLDKTVSEPEFEDSQDDVPLYDKKSSLNTSGRSYSRGRTYLIIGLCCLAVVALIVLAIKFFGGGSDETTAAETGETTAVEETTEEQTTAAWEKNSNAEVMSVVNQYYAALTMVDMTALQNIVDPSVTLNEEQIANEAKVVEGYEDIACYTTNGLREGEWVSYVTFAMKFKNISTPAPGLVPVYVRTSPEGTLKLVTFEALERDPELNEYVTKVANCDAIRSLVQQVEDDYTQAKASDATLAAFVEGLNGGSTTAETTAASGETTAASGETTAASGETTAASGETTAASGETTAASGETTAASGETTTAAATTAAASAAITAEDPNDFSEMDSIMYTTERVKCRQAPNANDETEFTVIEKGTKVQVTAKGNKWVKVIRLADGTSGYMLYSYLSDDAPSGN